MEKKEQKLYGFISQAPTRYLTIKQWTFAHPWPSERALRAYIYKSGANGFDKVFIRVGKRILIDEKAFFDWVKENIQKSRGEVQ